MPFAPGRGSPIEPSKFYVAPHLVSGPTFYVDGSSGNDSNDGRTPATAWQTITKVNAQTWIYQGTHVLFAGGQSFTGPLTPSNGLTAANPLVFGSYGTGNATIAGGSGAGFLAQNMGGITVQDLIFTGTSTTTNTANGVQFDNSQAGNTTLTGISVLRCTVSGFGLNGIFVSGSTGTSGFSNVLIDGCTAHDCTGNYTGANGTSGIAVESIAGYGLLAQGRATFYNVTIQNCLAYNNAGKAGATNWTGSGIFVGETNNGIVQYCTAHDNGSLSNFASGGPVGIWTFDSTNVTIQFCESYHNQTNSTADGDGFDLDGGCQNCTIQYCYSHDNDGAGFQIYTYDDATLLQDINKVVRFCISQNDTAQATTINGGISFGSDSTRAQTGDVYNNTVFSDLVTAISTNCIALGGAHASLMTGHIANNIFYSINNAPFISKFEVDSNPSGMVLVGNDYYNTGTFSIRWNSVTYTTFAAWQTATGQEKISGSDVHLAVDPQFTTPGGAGNVGGYNPLNPRLIAGYVPAPTSPVLDVGLDLHTLYSIATGVQDFFGGSVPNGRAYSVGASNPQFTVGYTTTPTAGAGNSYTAHFNFANGPYTMPSDGILQSCSFFLTGSVTGTAQLGVYGSSGGLPSALLAVTSTFSAVTGWQTKPTTSNPLIAAGTVIWMGAVDTVADGTLADANAGFTLYSGASGVSTLQNPFGTTTLQASNFQLGAYATFTPAPSAAALLGRALLSVVARPALAVTGLTASLLARGAFALQSTAVPSTRTWVPTDLGTAADLWFDANNLASFGLTGSNVNTWTDRINSCSVSFGTTKPVLTTSLLNGLPGVVFTASSSGGHGTTAKSVFAGDLSCFAVVKLTTISNFQVMFGSYIGGGTSYPAFAFGSASPEHIALFRAGVAANYASTGTLAVNTPALIEWTVPALSGGSWPGSGTANVYINGNSGGTIVAVTGFGAMTQTGVSIGDDSVVGNPLVGDFFEFIILPRIASTGDRQLLEGYACWKYGLQASLPGGHPYASAAPTVSVGPSGSQLTVNAAVSALGFITIAARGLAAIPSLVALAGRGLVAIAARTPVSGQVGIAGRGALASASRAIGALRTSLAAAARIQTSARDSFSVAGSIAARAALALRGVSGPSFRAALQARSISTQTAHAASAGIVGLASRTVTVFRTVSNLTVASAATAALLARALFTTRATSGPSGAAPIGGRATLISTARSATSFFGALFGRAAVAVRGQGATTVALSMAARALIALRGRASTAGSVSLAGVQKLASFAKSGLSVASGATAALLAKAALTLRGVAAPSGSVGLSAVERLTTRASGAPSGIVSILATAKVAMAARAASAGKVAIVARTALTATARAAIGGSTALSGRAATLARMAVGPTFGAGLVARTATNLAARFGPPIGKVTVAGTAAIRISAKALYSSVGAVAIYASMALRTSAQFGPPVGKLTITGASARLALRSTSAFRGATSLAGRATFSLRTVAASRFGLALASTARLATQARAGASGAAQILGRAMIAATAKGASAVAAALSGASRLAVEGRSSPIGRAAIAARATITVLGRAGLGLGGLVSLAARAILTTAARVTVAGRVAISARTEMTTEASPGLRGAVFVSARAALTTAARAASRVSLALAGNMRNTFQARAIPAGRLGLAGRVMFATRSRGSFIFLGFVSLFGRTLLTVFGKATGLTSFHGSRIKRVRGRVVTIVRLRGRIRSGRRNVE